MTDVVCSKVSPPVPLRIYTRRYPSEISMITSVVWITGTSVVLYCLYITNCAIFLQYCKRFSIYSLWWAFGVTMLQMAPIISTLVSIRKQITIKNASLLLLYSMSGNNHYSDAITRVMTSQITGISIVSSTVGSGADQKTSKLRVSRLCVSNSLVTGEFPAQKTSGTENVSIWWRHHDERDIACHKRRDTMWLERLLWLPQTWC